MDRKICIGRGLASISSNQLDTLYIYRLLKTKKSIFEKLSTGTTFKAINSSTIYNLLVQIPPLAEQKRIVQKIEEVNKYL